MSLGQLICWVGTFFSQYLSSKNVTDAMKNIANEKLRNELRNCTHNDALCEYTDGCLHLKDILHNTFNLTQETVDIAEQLLADGSETARYCAIGVAALSCSYLLYRGVKKCLSTEKASDLTEKIFDTAFQTLFSKENLNSTQAKMLKGALKEILQDKVAEAMTAFQNNFAQTFKDMEPQAIKNFEQGVYQRKIQELITHVKGNLAGLLEFIKTIEEPIAALQKETERALGAREVVARSGSAKENVVSILYPRQPERLRI